jgi:hypothetical protein
MASDHKVRPGDCVSSIAFENGFFPKTLWDLSENSELKQRRKDPNVLLEGDVVHVPDLRIKEDDAPTEQRHRYRRKGVPSRLKVQFRFQGEKLARAPYRIDIDGSFHDGATDADGWIDEPIPPNAGHAEIVLHPRDSDPMTFDFDLGRLDPVETPTGQQHRLKNLGFYAGSLGGEQSPEFEGALRCFQRTQGLTESGQADDATCNKLKSLHGS